MFLDNPKLDDRVRGFGKRLFALIEGMSGSLPERLKDEYVAKVRGVPFVYLRFKGARRSKNPSNSVRLVTKWHEDFAGLPAKEGDNLRGVPSADLYVTPQNAARAEQFIRLAFQLYGQRK